MTSNDYHRQQNYYFWQISARVFLVLLLISVIANWVVYNLKGTGFNAAEWLAATGVEAFVALVCGLAALSRQTTLNHGHDIDPPRGKTPGTPL